MRSTSRATRAAVVLAASALVLAGCGGETEPEAEPTDEETTSEATDEPTDEPTDAPAPTGDGTLTIGSLLPASGDLEFLGPPEFAGVELAIQDINAAGGVLGQDVAYVEGDSGDGTPPIAAQTVNRLLNQKVDVVIGAAASGVSVTVIEAITGAGAVQFSPANTSPSFDTPEGDPNELYFRTAPSDVLQGAVLANLATQDGHTNLGIINRQDDYGTGLAKEITKNFESGGGTVVANEVYAPDASNFNAEVQGLAAAEPTAVVVVGFAESLQIVDQMVRNGIGPKDVDVYFVDGNTSNYGSDDSVEPGLLEGVRGTLPGSELVGEFKDKILKVDPDLNDFSYAQESYDAVVVSALAAVAAGDDAGDVLGQQIIDITREGEKCTEFAACAELLKAGEDIDYDGYSGPIEMNEWGSPSAAFMGVYEYGSDNNYTPVEFIQGQI